MADQPGAEILSIHGTTRDDPLIPVAAGLLTSDLPVVKPSIKAVGCLSSTAIPAIAASTQLSALRRIYTPKPDPLTVDLEGVPINDPGAA